MLFRSMDTALSKVDLAKHIRLLFEHLFPVKLIDAPILSILAEFSQYSRAGEGDFDIMTKSKAAVIKIPGDHDSIFDEPHVGELARAIISHG